MTTTQWKFIISSTSRAGEANSGRAVANGDACCRPLFPTRTTPLFAVPLERADAVVVVAMAALAPLLAPPAPAFAPPPPNSPARRGTG